VEIHYLDAEDVIAVTDEFLTRLGYVPTVLRGGGRALLESAVARAQMAAHYAQADVFAQAAALANGIALSHAFVDGNKRSAFATCVTFLRVNGHPLAADAHLELAKQMVALLEMTDRSQADVLLADWLRTRAEGQ
jgi:death-on-curing protein